MARTPLPPNEKRVFINVPFDDEYAPLFQALLFTIEGCGFSPCCALEEPGNAKPRLLKIFNLIEEAALSIHDLSRTKLDKKTRLPRFNMPLELGICLGYRHLDIKGAKKRDCLIFEQTPYKHQQFISDLAGNDIVPHENNPKKLFSMCVIFSINTRHCRHRWGKKYAKNIINLASTFPLMCRRII